MIRVWQYVVAVCAFCAVNIGIASIDDLSADALAHDPSAIGSKSDLEIENVDVGYFPTVRVTVGVPGGLESIVANGGSFAITENGQSRPTMATNVLNGEDLEVVLVIDRSGSMAGNALQATKSAATGFIHSMPPEVQIGLVSFGSDVTLDVGLTADRELLSSTIAAIRAKGRTALNNAIVFASTLFGSDTERRVMVLLSDGADSASSATLAEAVAATTGTRVEIVELITPETNRAALDQLAKSRSIRSTADPAELTSLYASVAQSLVGRVEVVYSSAAPGGSSVDLVVQLVGAGQVRQASMSYNAPAQAALLETIDTAPAATSTLTNNTAQSTERFPWKELGAIMAIFSGLALLMIGIFVSPDRSMRRRLYPSNAPIENRSASETVANSIDHRFRNSSRYGKLIAAVENSGSNRKASSLVLNTMLITVVAMIAGFALMRITGAVVALFVVPIGSLKLLQRRVKRRRTDFVAQLPDTLQMLASMLRSGYGLVQALDSVANESDEPTHNLLGQVLLDVRTGRDLIESLRAVGSQVDSLDFDWVVAGIEISRDVGSDLATTLDTVAETIRERENLRGQISSLTAEGRLSAYVMLVLPPIVGVMSFVVNRDFAGVLFEGVGIALLAATGFLMFIGFIWMQSIIAKVS
ncbi:MAG: type II secretion system F family protein [Ilumatobacteraceae bacterium]